MDKKILNNKRFKVKLKLKSHKKKFKMFQIAKTLKINRNLMKT
jgi:hypothetical protein